MESNWGHFQPLRALKTGGVVAEFLESFEVTTWTAAEVEQLKRRGCLDVVQQRGDVLAHVMVARALPELVCVMLIMRQRPCGDVFDGVGVHGHSRSCYSIYRRVVNGQNPRGLIRLKATLFVTSADIICDYLHEMKISIENLNASQKLIRKG
jgi:hypothetical protein